MSKSEAAKDLAGRPGRRPARGVTPELHTPLGGPPEFLNELARKEWDRVMQELGATGLLQEVDQGMLAVYCMSYSRWQEAEAILASEGMLLKEPILNSRGEVKGHRTVRHPAVAIAKDEKVAVRAFGALFGLDPTNRSKIVIPNQQPQKSLLDKILDGDGEPN